MMQAIAPHQRPVQQAVILAGGKGTRLAERLHGLPKPLIDIDGKPLLERQVELLLRYGFTQILILVSHQAQQIRTFCESKHNWGLEIICIEDASPLGTAGATIAALPYLADSFLVMYGDTMLDVDLVRFRAFHEAKPQASASLFLHPNDHPQDSDLVQMNADLEITSFKPYPHPEGIYFANLVNAGLYFINQPALLAFRGNTRLLDFGKDLFPDLIAKGKLLRAYVSPEYIKDCGTPKRLDKVIADVQSGRVAAANLERPQAAVFLDRDGTLNVLDGYITKPEQFTLLPGVTQALARLNRSAFISVVVTNQPVLARGDCSVATLETIHNKMETLLGDGGAYVDRIEYCPHHPEHGFAGEVRALKIECTCRKPGTAMILRTSAQWHIEPSLSWLVGDSSADFLAAQKSDLRSIGVQTGLAGLDGKYPANPDFLVPDLAAAVDWILEGYQKTVAVCQEHSATIQAGDMVLIGGLSRSGKSTVAQCLKAALRIRGLQAHVLGLDAWLKNESMRTPGVMGRYETTILQNEIARLINLKTPTTVELGYYDKVKRQVSANAKKVSIKPGEVIIIEGVIALNLALNPAPRTMHTWYVELNEENRQKRVLQEYLLRGESLEKAQQHYTERLQDESPIIKATRSSAQHCIDLGFPEK